MITKNPMQLKAFIKKKAAEKNISAQLVMQNYMMERLLERISLSKYKHNFILKGGFLISAIVGLDTRATMDLDTTIKGFTLTHESIREIFGEICAVEIADDVKFELVDISDIREGNDYPGIRVALKANYPPINVPLTVDVTTGDVITPREIEYTFSLLFDDRTISILAYNLETVLAEKIETVLPAALPIPVREIFTTYIFCMLCAARSAMQRRCCKLWNGQRTSAAAAKCWKSTRTLSRRSAPANSSRASGKSISVILTMQRIFPLTMPAILSSALWTVSWSKKKVISGYWRNPV